MALTPKFSIFALVLVLLVKNTISQGVLSINAPLTAYQQNRGTLVVLECDITGTATSVSWYFNNQLITNSGRYINGNVNIPSLTISSVQLSDAGNYVCQATNGAITVNSNTITLNVPTAGSTPTVSITQSSYSQTVGNSVILACVVSSPNSVLQSVSWTFNNGASTVFITQNSNTAKYSGSTTLTPSLTIFNLASTDAGTYTCSATNTVGTGNSGSVTLGVTGSSPTVSVFQSSYSQTTGNSITLGCSVSSPNSALQSVSWTFNNGITTSFITQNSNTAKYSGSTTTAPSLTIFNLASTDAGTYTCTASNTVGTGNSNPVTLSVTGSSPTVTVLQFSYSQTTGNSITLGCSVSSPNSALQSVSWTFNNGVTTSFISQNSNTAKYSGSTTTAPSLTIFSVASTDIGTYTCTATNTVGTGNSSPVTLSVTGSTPTVTVIQSSYSQTTGNSVTLGCSVSSPNSALQSVSWTFNNGVTTRFITQNSNTAKYSGSTTTAPSLTIFNVVSTDTGTYTCTATNTVGTGNSSPVTLSVTGSTPTVTVIQSSYSQTTGNSVTLGCSVSSPNSALQSVSWTFNNGVTTRFITQNSNTAKYSGSTTTAPSLTILNVVSTDTGTYTCTATNTVGTGNSSPVTLSVTGSTPTVTVIQSSYSQTTGNSVTLGCSVSSPNSALQSVSWTFNNGVTRSFITQNSNTAKYSGSTTTAPSLTIFNVASTDVGTYTCTATNTVGTGNSSPVTLSVSGSTPVVTVSQSSYTQIRGSSITLGCSVSASNIAIQSVSWTFNNGASTTIIIQNSNTAKYSGSTTSTPSLTIFNLASTDVGTYTCRATNSIGTGTSGPITLSVTGSVPAVTVSQASYSQTTGGSITLGCSVSSPNSPLQSVSWSFNNGATTLIITQNSNPAKYSGSATSTPSLTISNLSSTDAGTYTCSAANGVGTGTSTSTYLSITGSVPTVSVFQSSYSQTKGTTITLGCDVSSPNSPLQYVTWSFYNGATTVIIYQSSNTAKYGGSATSIPSLTIYNLADTDAGTYSCLATNGVGTGTSSPTVLSVGGNLPIVTIGQSTYSVNIGNTISLSCAVSANPSHSSVYWTRRRNNGNDETLNIASSKYGGSTTVSPSLTIYNADIGDEGTYVCHATNAAGTGQSSQTFLDVIGGIPTLIASTVPTVQVGSSVTIQCTVRATPSAISVNWKKYINGQPVSLDMSNNRFTGGTTTSPSLAITSVQQDDQGQYICEATNSVGTGSSNQVSLSVAGNAPYGVTINPSTTTTNEGQTISATCTSQGSPSISYTWFKAFSNTQIQTGSVLRILSSSRSDSGTYRCRASNSYGNADSTITVSVQYVPDVTITAPSQGILSQSITIPCSYVADPAASNVVWTKGGQIISTGGTKYVGGTVNSPSLTITNLVVSDEGSYRCSVVNSVGQGDSTVVTVSVDTSGAPSTITITPTSAVVQEGQGFSLTCNANGSPSPTYQWFRNNVLIYQGNVLTVTNALYNNNDGLHTCKATNTLGSLQETADVDVQYIPRSAVSQSSFVGSVGSAITLSCDTNANPSATTWVWRNNGNTLGNTNKALVVDMNTDGDAGTYTCRASNSVGQSANVDFTITVEEDPGTGAATAESGLSTGEIAAIVLAVIFVLLLIIGIIFCYFCTDCCAKKDKKVEPQPLPKKIERYYEEPVAKVHTVEIPKFYEEPVVASEPPTEVRKIRRKKKVYRPPPIEYEVKNYTVLKHDDRKQLDSREITLADRYSDNSYVSTRGTRQLYLPEIEYTYDDEVERKRRRRKQKRSSWQYERQSDDLSHDYEFVVGERIEHGDLLRSSRDHEFVVEERIQNGYAPRSSRDNEFVVEERMQHGDLLRSSRGDLLRSSIRSHRSGNPDVLYTSSRSRNYDIVAEPEYYYTMHDQEK